MVWLWWLFSSWLTILFGWLVLQKVARGGECAFVRVRGSLKRILWFSVLLKVGGVVGSVVRDESHSCPIGAVALLFCIVLVMLELGWLFWRLYPLERRFRGVELGLWEYVRVRLGLVFELLAPLVAFGLMALTALYTIQGEYRQHGGWGVVMAGWMGTAGVALAIFYFRGRLILPVRPVVFPESLRIEIERMARDLGVSIREILVLDGRKVRMANAFALPGGRVALTDYLLAHLEPREILAVLAHEIAHLAQRRRLVRLWLYLLGMALGLTVGLAPMWQGLPSWVGVVLMGLLTGAMSFPMILLRARHEREADTYAISVCGADPLRSALIKTAQLNRRSAQERTDRLHPSLEARLRFIERFRNCREGSC